MSFASIGWKKLDGGRRHRLPTPDAILDRVRKIHPSATKEGSANGFSYWVDGGVVAIAWPVSRSHEWWCAITPTADNSAT